MQTIMTSRKFLKKFFFKSLDNLIPVVLDCFMGNESTDIACLNTNRDFIGIELDEGYFNIAQNRIEEAANN